VESLEDGGDHALQADLPSKTCPMFEEKNSKRVEVPIIVILLVARGQFKMSRFFFHPMHM
jgi:hypothetical protein